ncbi:MAG TPA: hypothetical protein VGG72_09315 [Bryobacteraceae bacterium]
MKAKKVGPVRARKKPRSTDPNQLMHLLGEQSTVMREESIPLPSVSLEISKYMAALGSKGGKIGGKKRLETLTQERRSQIAFKAAETRWKKARKSSS